MGSRTRFVVNVSVFVVVRRGTEVLLLRRGNTGWKDGCYSVPAGGHDGGETLADAAARELREETGLLVRREALSLVHLLHCRQGDGGGEWLGAFFAAGSWDGTPAIQEPHKHAALGWFDIDALPDDTIPYTRQGLVLAQAGIPYSTFGWDEDAAAVTRSDRVEDALLHADMDRRR